MVIVFFITMLKKQYIIYLNIVMTKSVWSSIDINCPNPNNSDLSFIDWLEIEVLV